MAQIFSYIVFGFFALLCIGVLWATYLSVKEDSWPPKDNPFWLDL